MIRLGTLLERARMLARFYDKAIGVDPSLAVLDWYGDVRETVRPPLPLPCKLALG